MVFYKKGAEAELTETFFDGKKALLKKRIPKNYRSKKLDDEIRKKRTRGEVKLIKNAGLSVKVPQILSVDEKNAEILMEFIEGKMLKELIESKPYLCEKAGQQIKKIHDLGIIHGDLTTSNIMVRGAEKKEELVFIDFGLGFFSKKVEDKATDLIVFKKTFNATHSSLKKGWEKVMKGYNPSKEMLTQMEKIEKRARYH